MIDPEHFYKILNSYGTDFFTGVPDSLLKSFCAYIADNAGENNIIAANEGNAVALAAGYYLASEKIPVVYMQNSGIGNAVNPIVSLADKMVYGIPMLVLIGWRGEPYMKDEPQHKKQGLITVNLIETLGMEYDIIDENMTNEQIQSILEKAYKHMNKNKVPYGIIVRKGAFKEYKLKNAVTNNYTMSREKAIEIILDEIEEESVIVSTTGMASRELFELREKRNEGHEKDFLTVGSMGHASSIALGIALNNKRGKVYCLDGDGAAIMHMGAMAIIGSQKLGNYSHIIINNGVHDSVGGQQTVGMNIKLAGIAEGCGYKNIYVCSEENELRNAIRETNKTNELSFIEIRVKKGARKNLGRPSTIPIENKEILMNYLRQE